MTDRYTASELDRMGRAVYAAARTGITCEAYDDLPNWRRHRWRQAAKAALQVAADVDAERREQWRRERRNVLQVS